MEDTQTQPGGQPSLETLKTRTMHDDLKKTAGQPSNPVPIAQVKPPLPQFSAPPASPSQGGPKPSIIPDTQKPSLPPQTPAPGAAQRVTPRSIPEPPMHLPGAIISPAPAKSVSFPPPQPPSKQLPTSPSPPPVFRQAPAQPPLQRPAQPATSEKPAAKPQPFFNEPAKRPVPPPLNSLPAASASSSLPKKLIIAGIIILLAGAGVYFFWPEQEPKPTCQGEVSPNCPPVTMINNIELLPVDAKNRSLDQITDDIKTGISGSLVPTVKLIALKTSTSPDTYATFDDLTNLFGLSMSVKIKENTDNFNLLAHINPIEATDGSEAKKEFRLLLILKQNDLSVATDAMKFWEPEMVGDLMPLLLDTPHDPPLEEFSTRVYNNGIFRYYSMPDYGLTINYVVTGNSLIIGTSRESIFYVYDLLSAAK